MEDVRELYVAAIRARNHLAVIIYDHTKGYISRVARIATCTAGHDSLWHPIVVDPFIVDPWLAEALLPLHRLWRSGLLLIEPETFANDSTHFGLN